MDRRSFYKKAMPVITVMLFLMSLVSEIIYRGIGYAEITIYTSIINWAVTALFLAMCFLVRRFIFFSWLVCPLLTLLAFYYFAFIDF